MAIVEKTIGSGKDHATVTLWEANVGNFGTDTYKGIIQENANFDENVTLLGGTGTPSITSYLWLTTDPANRHAGVSGTGHGRMSGTGADHIIDIDIDFTRVSWLEIEQDQTGSSDEGIRIRGGAGNLLIQYCILWSNSNGSDQDGIYTGDYDVVNLSIDNCIFYGWERAGVHIQQHNATARTINVNVDHCSGLDLGGSGENESGVINIRSNGSTDAIDMDVYNTWGAQTTLTAPFSDGDDGTSQPSTPSGTVTWAGSNNGRDDTTDHIQGTDNTTAWEDATDGVAVVTKSTGSWIVVNNITTDTEDLLLLDTAAGNLMAGNGVNRQGSEPDARQDFSVAIDGPRPTTNVDIGASQISTAGVTATALPHFASMIGA